jgi:hypothetical protein
MAVILDTRRGWRTQFWKGATQGSFQQSLVEIGSVVAEEKKLTYITGFFYELWTFAYFDRLCKLEKRGDEIKKNSSPLKLLSQSQPNFAEMILHLKKFLFLVMVAILDTGRHWRTQFWKGTTQGSFQQSLVEIGSVVSEEKICF